MASRRLAIGLLLATSLAVSIAYGIMLLLPLYVLDRGGTEADFGLIASAGAVTAPLAIGWIVRDPARVPAARLLAVAIGAFGAAAGIVALGATGPVRVGVGVLLGTAWAVVYTPSPKVMSRMLDDAERASYFGFLTGTQQLGIGLGPIVGRQLATTDLGMEGTFAAAAVIAGLAVVGCLLLDRSRSAGSPPVASAPRASGRLRDIVVSPAAMPLAIIVLFACLFAAMTSFQTTFARASGLDYSLYYAAYTIAVIAVRFGLAPVLRRIDQVAVIAASIGVVFGAMLLFTVVGANPILYVAAAAVLGLGYGVGLPASQAEAVNLTPDAARPRILAVAGLAFQTAILTFPLLAGAVITTAGYHVLFGVLMAVCVTQAGVAAWWLRRRGRMDPKRGRPSGERGTRPAGPPPPPGRAPAALAGPGADVHRGPAG